VNIFLDANICLDLLDTKRPTSEASVAWYMEKKDDASLNSSSLPILLQLSTTF